MSKAAVATGSLLLTLTLAAGAQTPPQCAAAKESAATLLRELEPSVSPQARSAAQQYVAKPGPGVSPEKAWGDFAAGIALAGNMQAATWAALKATALSWTGETVTNAGIYLFHLGRAQQALGLLSCAHAMGFRSPYLLEALATVNHKRGQTAAAREAIEQARKLLPEDRLIEVAASFVTTGKPPPPASRPPASDGLDEAVQELEQHGERVLRLLKTQADMLDRSLPQARAGESYRKEITYIQSTLEISRGEVQALRSGDAAARQARAPSALIVLTGTYARITDRLLSFPASVNDGQLLFWAEALSLDPAALARENNPAGNFSFTGYGSGPGLANAAHRQYRRDKEAGSAEYARRRSACVIPNAPGEAVNECFVREDARWCGVWKPLYERWADASHQRHNMAARRFDRLATRTVIRAENELLQARDYAVRQFMKFRFQKVAGFDQEKMTLQTVNGIQQKIFEKHLAADQTYGTIEYVQKRAQWFQAERSGMQKALAGESEQIRLICQPAMAALLELLLQEEWQAYLAHLRDRLDWGLRGQVETGEFPCEATIGPLTISTDLDRPGEAEAELKWSPKGGPISGSGSVSLSQDQTFGVGVGVEVSREDTSGSAGSGGFEGSTSYGPVQGKANVTFTNKVSPWNNREYRGIRLRGSAGLGLRNRSGKLSAACYPSSGSVTIYPRALLEDAVRYATTPSTRPK